MPLQTSCAESKEERILPLISPLTRSQHAHSQRIDTIPSFYAEMLGEELDQRIAAARAALGDRLVILGHHYQRDEIIKYADFRGDSFKLAQLAAARPQADYIVYCGVHFMAESADILSAPHQQVILPNLEAGCSMADMAKPDDVEACWDALRDRGIVCTSSNAPRVFDWAFERGEKVLFFPDEHLGRNTGVKKWIPLEKMVV